MTSTLALAQGFTVKLVTNGPEALSYLQHDAAFDVIIIDWKMPDMDGVETLCELSALELPHSPVVIMSTSYDRHDLEEVLTERGLASAAILSKPISASTLWDVLHKVMGGKVIRQQASLDYDLADNIAQLNGGHVLLVEDNAFNQELALSLLAMYGMTADLAENGQEALDYLAENQHYDGILMDCQMPIMDGYTASRKIRTLYGDSLPIIAMTANVMNEDLEHAKASGMNDYIAKPIHVDTMLKTMTKWFVSNNLKPLTKIKNPIEATVNLAQVEHIDTASGLATLANNSSLYRRLLMRFIEKFSAMPKQLAEMVDKDDIEGAALIIHSLKGTAGNVGTTSLHLLAADIEQALKARLIDQVRAKLFVLENELNAVLKDIELLLVTVEAEEDTVEQMQVSDDEKMQLLQHLRDNLEGYDSGSEASFYTLLTAVSHDEKIKLATIKTWIDHYDFERALVELNTLYN